MQVNPTVRAPDSVCPKGSDVPKPGTDQGTGMDDTAVFTCCLFISLFFSQSHTQDSNFLYTQRALGT